MALVQDFYDFAEQQGIVRDNIEEQQGEGFTLVSFNEEMESGAICNLVLVFYDDDDSVEIYIRKVIGAHDELALLKLLNEMNATYCGVSFYEEEDVVSEKLYCRAQGDIETVLREMLRGMEAAKEVFPQLG